MPNQRHDVAIDVLLVVRKCRALKIARFNLVEPSLSRLGYGRALAGRDVNAFAHIDLDRRPAILSILFALESFLTTVTGLIYVFGRFGYFTPSVGLTLMRS